MLDRIRTCLKAGTCVAAILSTQPLTAQPRVERVVFSWEQNGNVDLYLASKDGTGLRRLTTDPAADELPRCSPDGRELLFRRGGSARGELIRLDLDRLNEQQLTRDELRDSNPQWSLDGRTIYATKRIDGHDRIVSMDTSGQHLRVVSPAGEWHDVMPSVSADGRALVFHTYRYGPEAELQWLDLATGNTRRLTEAAGHDYEAAFAGEDLIVFSSNRDGGHYRIYLASTNGNTPARLLADTGSDAWGPRYSAATGDVLFYTGKAGAWRMMIVNVAGGPARPFLEHATSRSTADWC